MHKRIVECIINAINVVNEHLPEKLPAELREDCPLYQSDFVDSITLVTLIYLIEHNIEDEFKCSITLANEKAISMTNSPFLNVRRLTSYIEDLLKTSISL